MRAFISLLPLLAASACDGAVLIDSGRSGGKEPAPLHSPEPAPVDDCAAGAPITIAAVRSPAGLALGEGMLFFTDQGGLYECNGSVQAVPLSGGEPKVLVADLCAPNRIVYADGSLYWTSHSGYVAPNGDVTRLDLEDGSVEEIAAGLISPDAIAVDDTYVYVGSQLHTELQSPGRLVRVDLATHEQTVLGTSPGNVADISFDSEYVYWTGSVGFLNGKENHDSGVFRVRKGGGEADELLSGLAWPFGLARIDTRLILAHSHDGEILSIGADGAGLSELAVDLSYPQDVAVDGGEVFFTTWDGLAGLFSVPIGGGGAAPKLVAEAIGAADQVVLGSSCVYWTEQYTDDDFNGLIRRAAR